MSNIVNVYRQSVPKLAFVGRKYGDSDRQNGAFGHLWAQWFQHLWFAPLQNLIDAAFQTQYPEASAPIGLMRMKDGEPFEYWIGMFVPASETRVPEGNSRIELPEADFGIGWVEGDWSDVFCQEMRVMESLERSGISVSKDEKNALWFFERYAEGRFTGDKTPFVLDIGFLVKK